MVLFTLVVQDVVPDDFHAILRNREWYARHGAGYPITVGDQLGTFGVGPGGIVDTLRCGGAAPGRIDLQIIVGITLQQIGQASRQQLPVLGQIGTVDAV